MNIILDDNALTKLESVQAEFCGLSKSAVIRMLLAKFHGEEPELLSTHAAICASRAKARDDIEALPEDAVEPLEEAFFHMIGVTPGPAELPAAAVAPEAKPKEATPKAPERPMKEFDFATPRAPEPRIARSPWTRLR